MGGIVGALAGTFRTGPSPLIDSLDAHGQRMRQAREIVDAAVDKAIADNGGTLPATITVPREFTTTRQHYANISRGLNERHVGRRQLARYARQEANRRRNALRRACRALEGDLLNGTGTETPTGLLSYLDAAQRADLSEPS